MEKLTNLRVVKETWISTDTQGCGSRYVHYRRIDCLSPPGWLIAAPPIVVVVVTKINHLCRETLVVNRDILGTVSVPIGQKFGGPD